MSLRPFTISPPEKVGEVFGRGALAYRISVSSLAVILAFGIFVPLRIPDQPVDEYARLVQGERTGAV